MRDEPPTLGRCGGESELLVLARFWPWESLVRELLPQVIRGRELITVFQPIFRLDDSRAEARGCEELDLHRLEDLVVSHRPDFVKVDVLVGLFDNPMGRFNIRNGHLGSRVWDRPDR